MRTGHSVHITAFYGSQECVWWLMHKRPIKRDAGQQKGEKSVVGEILKQYRWPTQCHMDEDTNVLLPMKNTAQLVKSVVRCLTYWQSAIPEQAVFVLHSSGTGICNLEEFSKLISETVHLPICSLVLGAIDGVQWSHYLIVTEAILIFINDNGRTSVDTREPVLSFFSLT